MMTNKRFWVVSGLLLVHFSSFSQLFTPKTYPLNYFRNPLNVAPSLAGNFGELRPNHYHMGLDFKTQQRENLQVYASADGYVSRIKIEPGGFGRAIYIDHPNGFTTVYCHLNDFVPKLESFLKEQQYLQETWRIFLTIPPGLFPVKKGEFIAYSGNTGGSQGPHTHFEIRRTEDDVNVNPMLFGFAIPDSTRPSILRLAVYDRTKSTYEQSPRIFPVKRSGTGFITTPAVITVSSPLVSFALTAYDTHSGSSNLNGIYEAVLYNDDIPVTGFQMDGISYEGTRYLNAHIDYHTKANGGPYLQHLSRLPGYVNSIYKAFNGDGVIDLSDGAVHAIRVSVKDASDNTTLLNCKVQYNGASVMTPWRPGKMFYPLMLDVYESSDAEFYIGERCLYDSVRIRYVAAEVADARVISRVHTIGDTYIPLQDSMTVRIKPTMPSSTFNPSRIVMQRSAGAKTEVQKVTWQQGWASARFREFGNFRLVSDETPPQIIPSGFTNGSNLSRATRIVFSVKDNLGRYNNVRALLDGRWLRFTNDKGGAFIYRFDERCDKGEHTLTITADDEAGNTGTGTYHFTR